MDLADYFIPIFVVVLGALALGLRRGAHEWWEKRKKGLGR